MSKETGLREQLDILRDIKSIISAMKNLSFIEITKLNRFISTQSTMNDVITEAMGEFETFFQLTEPVPQGPVLYILLGSERGFCGGFNDRIFEKMMELSEGAASPQILAVGRKLVLKCEGQLPLVRELAAPNAVEEIPGVLAELVETLESGQYQHSILVHNEWEGSRLQTLVTNPFQRPRAVKKGQVKFPPLINMPPQDLYPQLLDHYIFSVFYRIFYQSFLAENHERLRHMDGALNALQKRFDELRLKHNMVRQEAITEELELLMLSKTASPYLRV